MQMLIKNAKLRDREELVNILIDGGKIVEIGAGLTAEAETVIDAEGNLTKGAKIKANYEGFHDCLAASKVGGSGPLSCKFGCLGYGTCTTAC